MPYVWNMYSKEILGYTPKQTPVNEEYVVVKKIEKWLNQGLTVGQIALKWNAGGAKTCSKGVNSKGIAYNSCEYVQSVAVNYKMY